MQLTGQKAILPLIPNEGVLCSAQLALKKNEFEKAVTAGCPLIFLETGDYGLVNKMLMSLLAKWQKNTYPSSPKVYEYLYGWGSLGDIFFSSMLESEKDMPVWVFQDARSADENAIAGLYDLLFDESKYKIILIKGFSDLIRNYDFTIEWFLQAAFQQYNSAPECASKRKVFVIAEPFIAIPAQLAPYSTMIRLPKPSEEEIHKIFDEKFNSCEDEKKSRIRKKYEENPEAKKVALDYLRGFSQTEIEYLLDYAALGNFSDFERPFKVAKAALAEKAAGLRLVEAGACDFAGLENLKDHLKACAKLLRHRAKFARYHLQPPKGILLVGMPGCGKSLAAKASAQILNRILLQLDMGAIMGKFVGESELNFRMALDIAEKSAPCVLWIDELEKAFAGMEDSTGITKRLFGYFLTWMQETKADIYIVATANNISKIPPEFKRKGRFDKIFSVNMPNIKEREEIFRYHLGTNNLPITQEVKQNYGYYARETSYKRLSSHCQDDRGVSGADIASIVQNAFCMALLESKVNLQITHANIMEAIKAVKGHTQRDIMKKQVISDNSAEETDGYSFLEKVLESSGYVSASKEEK